MRTFTYSTTSTNEFSNWNRRIRIFVLLLSLISISTPNNYFSNNTLLAIEEGEEDKKNPPSPADLDPLEQENIKKVEPTNLEKKSSTSSRKNLRIKKLTPEQIVKKKEVLGKVLKFGSNKERKDAMRELLTFPTEHSEELYKIVEESLTTDVDNGVKITALKVLSELEQIKDPKLIINPLKDKSEDVREAAVMACQRAKLEESTPELINLLKTMDFTKNSSIINNLINALADLKSGKDASEFLENKFKEKVNNASVRATIAIYFGKVLDQRAENVLLDAVADETEDPHIRSYSMHSLGKLGSQRSVRIIRNVLDAINDQRNKTDVKKNAPIKIYAISTLVTLGDKEILKDLVSYAKDDDPLVRMKALKQLSEVNDPTVYELIEYKAQRDPNRKVQEQAKKILEELKKKGMGKPESQAQNQPAKDGAQPIKNESAPSSGEDKKEKPQ